VSFDVYFMSNSDAPKPFSFGYVSSVGVSGIIKMANRWTMCLLTRKGSDPFSKSTGTNFMNMMGSNISETQDVLDMATMSIEDCNTQVRAFDQRSNLSPDERFASAQIERIEQVDPSRYDLWVTLKNSAGQTTTVSLPTKGY
jgi:hypothetical protein